MDLTSLTSVWELEEASGPRVDAVVASGNDLTDVNTVAQTTGKVGNCASFAAPNLESFSRASNPSLQCPGSFSIALWANLTTLATYPLVAKFSTTGGAGDREYYLAYVHGYGWQLVVRDSADTTNHGIIHSSGVATTGVWNFITAGLDLAAAGGPKVWINKNAVVGGRSLAAGPATPKTSNKLFTIGTWANGGNNFNGLMDQIVLFQRAFTPDDETELYNGGNGLSYAAMQPSGSVVPVLMNQYRQRVA